MTQITKYTAKAQVVAALRNQIATSDVQAMRALLRVFDKQTASEQASGSVQVYNLKGFTGTDATFLTSLAVQLKTKTGLSQKQLAILHRVMPKYANQLVTGSIDEGKIIKIGKYYAFVR